MLELLVAMAVLSIMIGLLATVAGGVSSAWSDSIDRGDRGMNARAIADFIRADLAGASLPLNQGSQDNLQFILNPSHLSSEYSNGDALFWQAPIATNRGLGEMAEVGYFVRWTESKGRPVPMLCRFFVNPAVSDSSGTPAPNPHYLIYSAPAGWLSDNLVDTVAPGLKAEGASQSYEGLFAENVAAIWFRCLDSQGRAFSRNFDSRVGQEDSYRDPVTGQRLLRRLPSSVQVSFVLLPPRVSRRLTVESQTTLSTLARQVATDIATDTPNDDSVSPAHQFVENANAVPALKGIANHLKGFTTTVSLANSP